jgi:hypothetical protein
MAKLITFFEVIFPGCQVEAEKSNLWLANCYFAHDSLGFPGLLPFFDG